VPHSLSASLRAAAILSVALLGTAGAEESALLPKARVAIVGDSITEQKLYSKYVECWLLACSGVPDVRVMQFGWGGLSFVVESKRLTSHIQGSGKQGAAPDSATPRR
jgi:hypothetical protein